MASDVDPGQFESMVQEKLKELRAQYGLPEPDPDIAAAAAGKFRMLAAGSSAPSTPPRLFDAPRPVAGRRASAQMPAPTHTYNSPGRPANDFPSFSDNSNYGLARPEVQHSSPGGAYRRSDAFSIYQKQMAGAAAADVVPVVSKQFSDPFHPSAVGLGLGAFSGMGLPPPMPRAPQLLNMHDPPPARPVAGRRASLGPSSLPLPGDGLSRGVGSQPTYRVAAPQPADPWYGQGAAQPPQQRAIAGRRSLTPSRPPAEPSYAPPPVQDYERERQAKAAYAEELKRQMEEAEERKAREKAARKGEWWEGPNAQARAAQAEGMQGGRQGRGRVGPGAGDGHAQYAASGPPNGPFTSPSRQAGPVSPPPPGRSIPALMDAPSIHAAIARGEGFARFKADGALPDEIQRKAARQRAAMEQAAELEAQILEKQAEKRRAEAEEEARAMAEERRVREEREMLARRAGQEHDERPAAAAAAAGAAADSRKSSSVPSLRSPAPGSKGGPTGQGGPRSHDDVPVGPAALAAAAAASASAASGSGRGAPVALPPSAARLLRIRQQMQAATGAGASDGSAAVPAPQGSEAPEAAGPAQSYSQPPPSARSPRSSADPYTGVAGENAVRGDAAGGARGAGVGVGGATRSSAYLPQPEGPDRDMRDREYGQYGLQESDPTSRFPHSSASGPYGVMGMGMGMPTGGPMSDPYGLPATHSSMYGSSTSYGPEMPAIAELMRLRAAKEEIQRREAETAALQARMAAAMHGGHMQPQPAPGYLNYSRMDPLQASLHALSGLVQGGAGAGLGMGQGMGQAGLRTGPPVGGPRTIGLTPPVDSSISPLMAFAMGASAAGGASHAAMDHPLFNGNGSMYAGGAGEGAGRGGRYDGISPASGSSSSSSMGMGGEGQTVKPRLPLKPVVGGLALPSNSIPGLDGRDASLKWVGKGRPLTAAPSDYDQYVAARMAQERGAAAQVQRGAAQQVEAASFYSMVEQLPAVSALHSGPSSTSPPTLPSSSRSRPGDKAPSSPSQVPLEADMTVAQYPVESSIASLPPVQAQERGQEGEYEGEILGEGEGGYYDQEGDQERDGDGDSVQSAPAPTTLEELYAQQEARVSDLAEQFRAVHSTPTFGPGDENRAPAQKGQRGGQAEGEGGPPRARKKGLQGGSEGGRGVSADSYGRVRRVKEPQELTTEQIVARAAAATQALRGGADSPYTPAPTGFAVLDERYGRAGEASLDSSTHLVYGGGGTKGAGGKSPVKPGAMEAAAILHAGGLRSPLTEALYKQNLSYEASSRDGGIGPYSYGAALAGSAVHGEDGQPVPVFGTYDGITLIEAQPEPRPQGSSTRPTATFQPIGSGEEAGLVDTGPVKKKEKKRASVATLKSSSSIAESEEVSPPPAPAALQAQGGGGGGAVGRPPSGMRRVRGVDKAEGGMETGALPQTSTPLPDDTPAERVRTSDSAGSRRSARSQRAPAPAPQADPAPVPIPEGTLGVSVAEIQAALAASEAQLAGSSVPQEAEVEVGGSLAEGEGEGGSGLRLGVPPLPFHTPVPEEGQTEGKQPDLAATFGGSEFDRDFHSTLGLARARASSSRLGTRGEGGAAAAAVVPTVGFAPVAPIAPAPAPAPHPEEGDSAPALPPVTVLPDARVGQAGDVDGSIEHEATPLPVPDSVPEPQPEQEQGEQQADERKGADEEADGARAPVQEGEEGEGEEGGSAGEWGETAKPDSEAGNTEGNGEQAMVQGSLSELSVGQDSTASEGLAYALPYPPTATGSVQAPEAVPTAAATSRPASQGKEGGIRTSSSRPTSAAATG